jgi:hypothetical protein
MSQEGTAPANNPTVPVATPELSLDALIDQKFSSPEFQSQTPHTNINFASVIDALPEDARKLVHNLREDYRKKTTELSQKTKQLQSREQSLLSKDTQERLAALSNLPEDVDLYNPDGLAKYIEAQAAKQLQSLLEPARQQQALESRRTQLDGFRVQNPDFDTYKPAIIELIEAGVVTSAEDAYYLVKGRTAKTEAEASKAELEAYKKAAREAGMKVSTGSTAQSVVPKFTNAFEAYQWRKNNPGK